MAQYLLTINNQSQSVEAEASKPLLWVLREDLGLTEAKFGCGQDLCGACTVYVDDKLVRSCSYPVASATGKKIVTISGLNDDLALTLKKAWQDLDVPQCGYCQPGFVLGAHSLLKQTAAEQEPDLSKISNICRCGTYDRIRNAIFDVHSQNLNQG